MCDRFAVLRQIERWLSEDLGFFDLTAQLMIDPDARTAFHMNAREDMTIAGIEVAAHVFTSYERSCKADVRVKDGARVGKGMLLMVVSGRAQALLTAERMALNIVQRLSGIATETAKYADAIRHTKCRSKIMLSVGSRL